MYSEVSFVKPGVKVTEKDKSTFRVVQPTLMEGCVIGLTEKGPAFKPVTISGYNEFVDVFGDSVDYDIPKMADVLFQNIGDIKVVRVLGDEGHTSAGSYVNLYLSGSAGTQEAMVLTSEQEISSVTVTRSGTYNDFDIEFSYSSPSVSNDSFVSASLSPSDTNYLGSMLADDLDNTLNRQEYIAVYQDFIKYTGIDTNKSGSLGNNLTAGQNKFDSAYLTAETPFVKTQEIGGTKYNLVKFQALQDGKCGNDIKIGVADIKLPSENPDGYSSFTINVMKYDDTVLEAFNCSLNPESDDYIMKAIGDELWQWDTNKNKLINNGGNYPNQSQYIRIKQFNSVPQDAAPRGFAGYPQHVYTGTNQIIQKPDYKLNQSSSVGLVDNSIYMGFEYSGGVGDFFDWHGDLYTASGTFSDFEIPTSLWSGVNASRKTRRFVFSPYGGFDGLDYFSIDSGSSTTHYHDWFSDSNAKQNVYYRAIDTISDPLQEDVAWLILPYVNDNSIQNYAIQTARDRGDMIVYLEAASNDDIDTATSNANQFDTSYGAMYFPNVKRWDSDTEQYVDISILAYVAKAVGYTDDSYKHWYTHAGTDRGRIVGAKANIMLSEDNIETLYDNNVNPIATFRAYGPTIWGNKTLYAHNSALNRIHARKLLIYLKKAITNVGHALNFEPNVGRTWDKFVAQVRPYLEEARKSYGLEDYQIKMDSETNTASIKQQNIMYGEIYLVLSAVAEQIQVAFEIAPAGASFNVVEG